MSPEAIWKILVSFTWAQAAQMHDNRSHTRVGGVYEANTKAASIKPASLRLRWSTRPISWLSGATGLALMSGLLLPAPGFAAAHVWVHIDAGQTYVIKDLDPDATPEVTFLDNNPFTLQC